MQDFRKLLVWQKAHALTLMVYHVTIGFPESEKWGITNQLRRAAASIAANIAEGCGRNSQTELARFLKIANGSAGEVHYFVILSRDLGYLQDGQELFARVEEVKRMLAALLARIHTTGSKASISEDADCYSSTLEFAAPQLSPSTRTFDELLETDFLLLMTVNCEP